jgi:hypothetical protein
MMIAAGPQARDIQATQCLQILRSLTGELKLALHAILHNALPEFEESVADQEVLSTSLSVLAVELSCSRKANHAISRTGIDSDLKRQILVAAEELQTLNRGYAALLQHSSHSVALMISLIGSLEGQFKEASGPGSKCQTWCCQM